MTNEIEYIVKAHENYARRESKRYRKWDGETPYYVHPLWCAMTIASETKLDKRTRDEGFQAFLYHDILEDTTAGIPEEHGHYITDIVEDMTFESFDEEMEKIWDKPKEIRLYKLYDKVNNLMDGCWMDLGKRKKYEDYTRALCEDVERNYGELNIRRFPIIVLHFVRESPSRHSRFLVIQLTGMSITVIAMGILEKEN